MCRSNSPSFSLGLAVGGRVRLSPFAARPFAAGEPHVRRHSCFSPAVYGTRAGHPSAQHFSLRHPEQGHRGLSFTVEGAAASRPSRHPILGMSSLARHYDFTRAIAVGSPHNSNRLHSSVWEKSPPFRRGSPDSSKQRRQGFCSTTGTFLPPAERSNRGSTAVGSRTRFLQPLLPRSKEGRRLEAYPGSTAFESFPLQREVKNADDENHHVSGPGGRLVCHHRPEGCVFSHPGRSQTQEIPSVRLWREGLPIQGSALRPGFGPEDIYQMHGCCTGPFEAPGHPCTELSGRLAHSGSLQGASESSQGYRSRPHPFSWPQDERQEECAPPISTNCISRSLFGFRSDAGPFGSCPDTSFYSMFGPFQARPSCLCRYLPQAVGPYGSSLPCVAPRAASHEAIPLEDEGAEVTPHCTSYSPCQSVAQLLSTPVNVARPRLSPERGENGCDPPSPYDHDGRINDRLGRGLRRKAGEWRVEGRVPLLAYKLAYIPLEIRAVFLALKYFLPVLGEHHVIVRMDNMAVVSHINRQGGSRLRTLDRLARHLLLWSQDKFLSLRAVHVPGVLNLAADFLSRQKLKPGEWMLNRQTVSQIWDLFGKAEVDLFASQESSQCPLWFSLSFPTTLGIDAFAHPWPNVSLYAFQ